MKIASKLKYLLVVILSCVFFSALAANNETPEASVNPTTNKSLPQSIIPAAPTLDARGYVLMDANTGAVLAGKDIDTTMPPASLTKLMTLYQIASALKTQRLQLSDLIPISENAWRTGGSKMFVKVGSQVPVSDLIQGIAVVSGNDACVAMAEHLAGTEQAFSDLMNHSAKLLGMKNTNYTDATGLPNANHYTSPRDLAILTKAIVNDFPEYYGWYSQKWFEYNGIKQPNRDVLLWRDPSIEGMKTGHTDDAGYCLVSTAKRNNMRLISVIMGSKSTKSRADASLALLNYGFRFYESKQLIAANTAVKEPRVWYGAEKNIPVGTFKNVFITLPTGQVDKAKTIITLNPKIKAPLKKGQEVGNIEVQLNDKVYLHEPLVALKDDPKGGLFRRLGDHVAILFAGLFSRSNA